MLCRCGCGRVVQTSGQGRKKAYYSGACRVRVHRQSHVTKVEGDVTKETGSAQPTPEELHRQIVEEHAVTLWLLSGSGAIPIKRADTTYHVFTNANPNKNRHALYQLPPSKEYRGLLLSDEEVIYCNQYAYEQLLERYRNRERR